MVAPIVIPRQMWVEQVLQALKGEQVLEGIFQETMNQNQLMVKAS